MKNASVHGAENKKSLTGIHCDTVAKVAKDYGETF
jgi:hypothetical protein